MPGAANVPLALRVIERSRRQCDQVVAVNNLPALPVQPIPSRTGLPALARGERAAARRCGSRRKLSTRPAGIFLR